MTKFSEFKEQERESKINIVDAYWISWREARQQALTRATNYLFVLNTGALLGALTYVAAKPAVADIKLSIWLFSVGVLFSVMHAGIDYYSIESGKAKHTNNVYELYSNELDWEVYLDRNKNNKCVDFVLHILGWAGGISFFSGLVIGVCQIK